MTKKDYLIIAKAIELSRAKGIGYLVALLSEMLLLDNPKFDKNRFVKLCGFQVNEIENSKDN